MQDGSQAKTGRTRPPKFGYFFFETFAFFLGAAFGAALAFGAFFI